MGSTNLVRLEEITRALKGPPGNGLSVEFVEYDVGGVQIAYGFSLLNEPDVSVQKATMSAGTAFPGHAHPDSVEWLICISGSFMVHFLDDESCGEMVCVARGGGIMIPAGAPHTLTVEAHTRLLGITIPPAGGYPGVKRSEQ